MEMKKLLVFAVSFTSVLLCFESCNSRLEQRSFATDSTTIALGQNIFEQNCSACHTFRQDGIGPQLGGITREVPVEWIRNFIKDPKAMIESGDERAVKSFEKFRTMMPGFPSYSEDEMDALVAFLHTHDSPAKTSDVSDSTFLKDPLPQKIGLSDLVVELELFCQIPPSSDELPRTRIAKLDPHPNTGELFMLDLRGKLYKIQNKVPRLYMDMQKLKKNFIHKPGLATGFGSFAFHPEFQKNGLLYTTHTESAGSGKADFAYADSIPVTLQWVLSEWKTDQSNAFPFAGKGRELFRVNMESPIHGVQEIIFNPLAKPGDEDYGLLYIGIGDGGSVEHGFPHLAHSTETIWGTILRIDPAGRNSMNKHYGIPAKNPFVQNANANTRTEIYALGFRNPHRITWSATGQMLATNIGHGNIESVNIIYPGHDYGWPIREGTFVLNPKGDMNKVFALPADDSIYHVTYPVVQYDHDEGKAICGGYEYTGSELPALKGMYLFGDIPAGRLFYVQMKDLSQGKNAPIKEWRVSLNNKVTTLADLCGTGRVDLRLARDAKGEMYLFTKPDGKVYKMVGVKKEL
jgi:glucose/arabinose dehydrogenase/mono/diheme cytochrome c family protein